MKFFAPMAFWFAAVMPVVILFYLLKRRRAIHLISSTLLWQRFLAETQASAPFQRLRHNWLMILQLLMLALVIAALARPYFSGEVTGGSLQVVILDASASMQSTDEAPSRFEKARAEAMRLVDGLRDSSQMVVLQAGANTEVLQSATSEKGALRRAMAAAKASDSPTRLKESLRLAQTLTRDRPDAEIHLLSDGAVTDLAEFENKGLNITYHRVGQRGRNIGVVSLDVKPHPEDPAMRAVFASVANHSTNAQPVQVELRFKDQLLETKSVEIAPGATESLVFVATQPYDGVFTLKVGGADDLAVDNQASVVSQLPRPVNVLLVSKGNRFIERALKASPNIQLALAPDLTEARPPADFVVLDDVQPSVWPDLNVLAINTAPTNWFESASRVEGPAIVDWKFNHPLLRFVKFDNVQIASAWKTSVPSWSAAIVEASDTPLVLAGEVGRQRVVWIGFDTLQSTWPLRVSFPIFIANAADWLNPASVRSGRLSVQAGSPLRFGLTESVSTARVTLPDGTTQTIEVDPKSPELLFGGTTRQGVYRLSAGTNDVEFCVNLLDPAESDTRPREELSLGAYVKVGATSMRRANLELWRWVALVGVAILMVEWWYYHRRTA